MQFVEHTFFVIHIKFEILHFFHELIEAIKENKYQLFEIIIYVQI